jgi:hypothetical protein
MRTKHIALASLLALAACKSANPTPLALTAAQVVEKNAAARGGVEAWRKVQSMAWTGHVETANGNAPFLLEMKRPDHTRFELTMQGQRSVRVFDGTVGWKMRSNPPGPPDVQPYSVDEVRFARGAPVIDGPLMDYAAKGASISLGGIQEIEGRKAYALELRLASGNTFHVWIDAETFLELRYDRDFVNAKGAKSVSSMYFADYRSAEGLRLPYLIETGTSDGKTRDKLVLEQVVLNPAFDDRAFAKPGLPGSRQRGVTVDTRGAAQEMTAR